MTKVRALTASSKASFWGLQATWCSRHHGSTVKSRLIFPYRLKDEFQDYLTEALVDFEGDIQ